ncbi:hypothetical protein Glove_138g47 [Diversispora epigaea]|uniref:Tc1-like transposase DDE domain-containing protein n=1 Tax=Diversispora epigaea TaxID=1348612 RepID=A0A397J596_9GLOM|nr:hypothetical protein Glove_138g47 [Diversispora epigaea]
MERTLSEDLCWKMLQVMNPYPEKYNVIIMDNTCIHHNAKLIETIETLGCRVIFLPPYSPNYNSIETYADYYYLEIQSIKKAPHRSAHRCLDCYAPATDRLRSINKASDRTLNHPHRTPNPRTIPLCVRPKNNVYLNIASVPIPGPFHRPNPPPDIDTRQKLCKNTIWNKNKPRQQPDQQLTL